MENLPVTGRWNARSPASSEMFSIWNRVIDMSVISWLIFKLPVAVVVFMAGVLLCCTFVLLPIGTALVDSSLELLC